MIFFWYFLILKVVSRPVTREATRIYQFINNSNNQVLVNGKFAQPSKSLKIIWTRQAYLTHESQTYICPIITSNRSTLRAWRGSLMLNIRYIRITDKFEKSVHQYFLFYYNQYFIILFYYFISSQYLFIFCNRLFLIFTWIIIIIIIITIIRVMCVSEIFSTHGFFQIPHFLRYVLKILKLWNSLPQGRRDQRRYTSIFNIKYGKTEDF